MQMRAFSSLLSSAAAITAVDNGDGNVLREYMDQLETVNSRSVRSLVTSGQLDLRGDVVEWRGTTWVAFIEDCRQKVDDAGRLSDDATLIGAEEIVETDSAVKSGEAMGVKTASSSTNNEYGNFSEAVGAREISNEEHEAQLGFAYWALGKALWKLAKDKIKLVQGSDEKIAALNSEEGEGRSHREYHRDNQSCYCSKRSRQSS
jgi:hypothetical protein